MLKSIQKRIFIVYLLVTVGMFIVSFVLLYKMEENNLLNQTFENSLKYNEIIAYDMGLELKGKIERLQYVAENYADGLDQDVLMKQLDSLLNNPHYGFVTNFYIDLDGYGYFPGGEVEDLNDRAYLAEMRQDMPDYVISEPIIGRVSKEEVFVIGVPLLVDGEYMGLIGGSTRLSDISVLINDKNMPLNSYAWIVDTAGLIIAHPNDDLRMSLDLSESKDYVNKEGYSVWEEIRGRENGYNEYTDYELDVEKIMTFYRIEYSGGWTLGFTTLRTEILGPIRMLRNIMIIVAFVGVCVLTLLNYWISGLITRPIVMLTKAVSSSKSNRMKKIKLESTGDEIETLIMTYNDMAERIERHTLELEDIVEDRTNDLETANLALASQNQMLSEANEKLFALANVDPLTGLLNRRHIIGELNQYIYKTEKGEIDKVSLLFIDLDYFKYYNDRFGHSVGDKLLKLIADILTESFGHKGRVGRYGGDEFIVVLPNIDLEETQKLGEALRKRIRMEEGFRQQVIHWLDLSEELELEKSLDASYGAVCHYLGEADDIDTMLHKADSMMYKFKKEQKASR